MFASSTFRISAKIGTSGNSLFISLIISFNAKYIIDVLKAIDAENFIFSFNQPLTTASIAQRDNKNFVYVVTPVRTKTM